MDILIECSEIMNDEFSQFLDGNSQICINEESFAAFNQSKMMNGNASVVETPQNGTQTVKNMISRQLSNILSQQPSNQSSAYNSYNNTYSIPQSAVQSAYNSNKPASGPQPYQSNQTQNHPQQKQQSLILQQQEQQNSNFLNPQTQKASTNGKIMSQNHDLGVDISEIVMTIDDQINKQFTDGSTIMIMGNNDDCTQFIHGYGGQALDDLQKPFNELSMIQNSLKPTTQIALQDSIQKEIPTSQQKIDQEEKKQNIEVVQSEVNKPQTTANKTWQKVNITKRRTSNNVTGVIAANENNTSNNPILAGKALSKQGTSMIISNKLSSKNVQQVPLKVSDYNQIQQQQPQEKPKRKLTQPGEIVPVFDCLFCCQEHFVLFKINEQVLNKKYAQDPQNSEEERHKYLYQMHLKHQDMFRGWETNNTSKGSFELKSESQEENNGILKFEECMDIMFKATLEQPKSEEGLPMVMKLLEIQNQKSRDNLAKQNQVFVISEIQPAKIENQCSKNEKSNDFNFFAEHHSILDESNFGNINLRTRRQKVLQNISFESDFHNIYDPLYTSEEEDSSVNLDDSSDESVNEEQSIEDGSEECNNDEDEDEVNDDEYDNEVEDQEDLQDEVFNETPEIIKLQGQPQVLENVQISVERSDSYHMQEVNKSNISSIEQQNDDEEGFNSSDDEVVAPDVYQDKQQEQQNLNIQENYVQGESDGGSERYTFGCITPKEYELEEDPKVTFSNCQGENSLSPVRIQKAQKGQNDYYDHSPSHQKNPMLLEHSPISCNGATQFIGVTQGFINQVRDLASQGEIMINNSASYIEDNGNGLSKINFNPSQMIDSIDLQINHQQQRSYDIDIIQMPNMNSNFSKSSDESIKEASSSQVHEEEDDSENEQSSSQIYDQEQCDQFYDYASQNMGTQYFGNQNDLVKVDFQISGTQQQQSKSFMGGSKYKHQKLIPNLSKGYSITNQGGQNHKFLIKQEQFVEFLKKAKSQKQNNKQFKIASSQHLISFDSILKNGLNNLQGQQQKQKTQTLCTPLETEIIIPPQQQVAKTNATTTNQVNRRQNSNNIESFKSGVGTCKNNNKGQYFQLGGVPNLSHNTNTNPDVQSLVSQGQDYTIKGNNTQLAKFTKNKTNHQKLIDNYYFQDNQMPQAATTMRSNTVKGSNSKKNLATASPNIMLNKDKTINYSAQSQINPTQLSQKDINQFFRQAMCSSRYSTTSGNIAQIDNFFKQLSVGQEQSTKKKKQKSKIVNQSKNFKTNFIGNQSQDLKKTKKPKHNKKKSNYNPSIIMQHYGDYYQNQQQLDFQNYLNVCNSINFSNDCSIPSLLSQMPCSQKSNSLNTVRNNMNSKTMYTSIQDAKNMFSSAMNLTNIQDTSNNNPYGAQGEMSTTISGGCISNNNTVHQQHSQTGTGCMNSTTFMAHKSKLNGSIDDLQINCQFKKPKSGRKDSFPQNARLSQRGSISLQRNAINQPNMHHPNVKNHQALNTEVCSTGGGPGNSSLQNGHLIPGHGTSGGQFSFSQSSLKLNQTASLEKKLGIKKSKKGKVDLTSQGSKMFMQLVNPHSTQSSNTIISKPGQRTATHATVTNENPQKKNSSLQRPRSSSKSSHNVIKTDVPTHQLLLNNQHQALVKTKQIQMNQNKQNTMMQSQQSLNKSATTNKHKNTLMIQHSEHNSNIQDAIKHIQHNSNDNKALFKALQVTQHTQPTYQAHLSSNNHSSHQCSTNTNNQPHQAKLNTDLGKFYDTGRILLSNVTSPMRSIPQTQQSMTNGQRNNNLSIASNSGIMLNNMNSNQLFNHNNTNKNTNTNYKYTEMFRSNNVLESNNINRPKNEIRQLKQ